MYLNTDRLTSHGLTTRFGCPLLDTGVGERYSEANTRLRKCTRASEGRVGHRPEQPGGLTMFFVAGDTRCERRSHPIEPKTSPKIGLAIELSRAIVASPPITRSGPRDVV